MREAGIAAAMLMAALGTAAALLPTCMLTFMFVHALFGARVETLVIGAQLICWGGIVYLGFVNWGITRKTDDFYSRGVPKFGLLSGACVALLYVSDFLGRELAGFPYA